MLLADFRTSLPQKDSGGGGLVAKSCVTLATPFVAHQAPLSLEIFQARILEWVAISSSRRSSWPGDRALTSCGSCFAGGFFTASTTREASVGLWSKVKWSRSVVSNSLQPHGLWPTRLLGPWDFPGMNPGLCCHFLLQGIFLTQGSNPKCLHCRQTLYCLSHQGTPRVGF